MDFETSCSLPSTSRDAARAASLRHQVLEPLRKLRPPPAVPEGDPDWISVSAGSFQMGSSEGEGAAERPRREVMVSAFRI